MTAYATPEQLAAYIGEDPPEDAERLLERASRDIDSALLTAVYATDPVTGAPTDARVLTALANAVCAQVEYWLETGDTGTGASDRWGSVSIGPVSLGDRRGGKSSNSLDLAPRAYRELRAANLNPGTIFSW